MAGQQGVEQVGWTVVDQYVVDAVGTGHRDIGSGGQLVEELVTVNKACGVSPADLVRPRPGEPLSQPRGVPRLVQEVAN